MIHGYKSFLRYILHVKEIYNIEILTLLLQQKQNCILTNTFLDALKYPSGLTTELQVSVLPQKTYFTSDYMQNFHE